MANALTGIAHAWFDQNPAAGLLLVLMIFDILTGLLRAIRDRKLASDISAAGMNRKVARVCMVMFGEALERFIPGLPASETIAAWYCATEAISVFENAALLGAPLPDSITKYFAKLNPEDNQRGDGPSAPVDKRTDGPRGTAADLAWIAGERHMRSK